MGKSAIGLLLVLLAAPALAGAASNACSTGFTTCAQRDAWRAGPGRENSPYPSAQDVAFGSTFYPFREQACSTDNAASSNLRISNPVDSLNVNCLIAGAGHFNDYCLFKKAYDSLDENLRLEDQRRSLVILLRQFVSIVQAKRSQDLAAVREFARKHSIKQAMSMDDVKSALSSFSAHVRVAASRLGAKNLMHDYFNTFVAQQIVDDSKKKPSFLDTLANDDDGQPRTDQERFKFLVDRANTIDDHDFEDGLTPYYARMLLLFNAADAVEATDPKGAPAALSALARSLALKVNLDESSAAWKNIIPHDGYVLGASPAEAANLLGAGEIGAKSTGIDCSLLMQEALQKFGYSSAMFKTRASTDAMIQPGAIKSFNRRRICSEKDVQLGDIIVHSGHTYVFAGYTDEAKPQLRVIEALGEGDRTVRESAVSIYLDETSGRTPAKAKKTSKKTQAKVEQSCASSILTESQSDPYYVLEPAKDAFSN